MATQPDTSKKPTGRGGYKITLKRAKVAGILGLGVVLIAIILMSPLFDIESIEINMNTASRVSQVRKCLGFSEGDNIFSIDVDKATESVESLDRVDKCSIERTLSGKVTVTVSEKTEVAYIKIGAGYAGIDDTGKVMKISKTKEETIPVIKGIKIAEPQKNDYIKSEDKKGKEKTEFLIRLVASLKEHGIHDMVETVDITKLNDVSMMLTSDTLILLGEDGDENKDRVEYKIAFLKAILTNPDVDQRPSSGGQIDLSNTSMIRGTA